MIRPITVIFRGKRQTGYLVRDVSGDGGEVRVPKIRRSFELYPPEKFDKVFENQSTVYILNKE